MREFFKHNNFFSHAIPILVKKNVVTLVFGKGLGTAPRFPIFSFNIPVSFHKIKSQGEFMHHGANCFPGRIFNLTFSAFNNI